MNGSIKVRSKPGHGCSMTVTLPKANRPFLQREMGDATRRVVWTPDHRAAQVASGPVPLEDVAAPGFTEKDVLLVEDDPLVASAMRQLLESWGLQVRHVQTAVDAFEQTAFGQIAICDVRLPHGASGLDVALRMRAQGKKVLLLSAETQATLREAAHRHKLVLLTKPVSSARLLAALQSL